MKRFLLTSGLFGAAIPLAFATMSAPVALAQKAAPPSGAAPDAALPPAVLIDSYRQSGDSDDTNAFRRACASGAVNIRLGAKTYIVNDFSGCAGANFTLSGVAGASTIKRVSASSEAFFRVDAAHVLIDGVSFDMNAPAVNKDQRGVYFGGAKQNIVLRNSKFANIGPTANGVCVSIFSDGPGRAGSVLVENNEFTSCNNVGLGLFSVSNAEVHGNNFHDSLGIGVRVGLKGQASATNFSSNININNNKFVRYTTGAAIGNYSAPFSLKTMPAQFVSVDNNYFEDVTHYSISLLGYDLFARHNKIRQSSPSVHCFGAINAFAVRVTVADNDIQFQDNPWGIDVGGSVEAKILHNQLSMTKGGAINIGGNLNSVIAGNSVRVSGDATAIGGKAFESGADPRTTAFPTLMSNVKIQDNQIQMIGPAAVGVRMKDNAGAAALGAAPVIISHNNFTLNNGANADNAIIWYGDKNAVAISDNLLNGSNHLDVSADSSGVVRFPDALFGGVLQQAGAHTANAPFMTLSSSMVRNYASPSFLLYAYPTARGRGYSAATSLTPAIPGCDWTGNPVIVDGAIVGVMTTRIGTKCPGATSLTVSDPGGGSGAVILAGTRGNTPLDAQVTWVPQACGAAARAPANALLRFGQTDAMKGARQAPPGMTQVPNAACP